MKKEIRKELEELSLKAFGNKNYYRKVSEKGILYRDPETRQAARIRLSDDGLKQYILKTIKVREDFLKASEVLKKEKENDK